MFLTENTEDTERGDSGGSRFVEMDESQPISLRRSLAMIRRLSESWRCSLPWVIFHSVNSVFSVRDSLKFNEKGR